MPFLAFLQSNAIADLLNNTEWGFAIAECFHIVFFAVAIGTILIVDLRLLGLAFPRTTSAKMLQDTWAYTLIALTVTVLAGMGLCLTDPHMYLFARGSGSRGPRCFWRSSITTPCITRSLRRARPEA
jgi:hypothetical protein